MSEYQEALSLLKTVEESLTEKDEELERFEDDLVHSMMINTLHLKNIFLLRPSTTSPNIFMKKQSQRVTVIRKKQVVN